MAEIWARPTAFTTWVVAMLPTPTPTRTLSAPASITRWHCRCVATLPLITSTWGKVAFSHRIPSRASGASPWRTSSASRSTPAAASAAARSFSSDSPPSTGTAAPTFRLLVAASLVARGNSLFLIRSIRVVSARRHPSWSMTGKWPFLLSFRIRLADSRSQGCWAQVSSATGVITAVRGWDRSVRKSVSRLVTMPSSRAPTRPSAVTGTPEMPFVSRSASRSSIVASGARQ
mmetsp:Transcript_20836/g.32682  ORF Transcript_20836/g.32682 Transcript_20836/m.32682 type:complete len:231 (-) Transcript_20836:390-1082(-)